MDNIPIRRPLIVMLDLEGTLIDSWNSGVPLNNKIKEIKRQINNINNVFNSIETYGIFSFAIDHEYEKTQGVAMATHATSLIFNPNFVTSFDDLMQICRFQTDQLQKWEIVNLLGKDLMFPMWCLQFPDKDFMLFDDALPQETITLTRVIDKNNTQIIQMRRV